MVGRPFTLRLNEDALESEPSLTTIVIVAEPDRPAAGVIVTVRLEPVPPKTIRPAGTSAVSLAVPLRIRLPAGVSASATANATGPVVVSALID